MNVSYYSLDGKTNRTLINPWITCGFPGIGKSYLTEINGHFTYDSDSSKFSWLEPGVRNPAFPQNYLDYIKTLSGLVLVSSHKIVRDALAEAGAEFWVCYPERKCKGEYLERYRLRSSPKTFIDLLDSKWDEWITEMEDENRCFRRIVLAPGQYISDISNFIKITH